MVAPQLGGRPEINRVGDNLKKLMNCNLQPLARGARRGTRNACPPRPSPRGEGDTIPALVACSARRIYVGLARWKNALHRGKPRYTDVNRANRVCRILNAWNGSGSRKMPRRFRTGNLPGRNWPQMAQISQKQTKGTKEDGRFPINGKVPAMEAKTQKHQGTGAKPLTG
jgi:hypothetical protein